MVINLSNLSVAKTDKRKSISNFRNNYHNLYFGNRLSDDYFLKNKSDNKNLPEKSKWLTKETLIVGGAGLALSATVGAICLIKRKGGKNP